METDKGDEEKLSKIKKIIEREIAKEIVNKQNEVTEITEKIEKALRHLDILKYVVTLNYYEHNAALSSKKVSGQEEDFKDDKIQNQIHPCVKRLLPFRSNYAKTFENSSRIYETRKSKRNDSSDLSSPAISKDNNCSESFSNSDEPSRNNQLDQSSCKSESTSSNIQMPQYVPPLPNPDIVKEIVNSPRGGSSKVQHRIIVGNISKWIPPDTREDNSTHKWMVYIRSQDKDKDKDITRLIRKVRYFLHESYKPHDIIDVTSAPFHLTRRGWGEFPIRIQLHFHHPLNKPVDIIHHLKLDMTCSGVQTLGAETVVELCLHQNNASEANQLKNKKAVENDYANGKKTFHKSDVFDGNLLTSLNGIKSEKMRTFRVKEETPQVKSTALSPKKGDGQTNNARSLLISNNSKLMLDRRKLQELISREHDYNKNESSNSCELKSLELAGNSLLKLVKNCENGSVSFHRNGTVFDTVKISQSIAKRTQNLSRMEVSLTKSESEIFKNLKSVVRNFEGESQSKYCMKVFKHSYLVNILQRAHATKLKTVESLLKWFLRRWPIVTKLALDPTYKHIHPYSCPTEEEFFQYNIGKQRSAEWFRAKAIQKILISLKSVIPIDEEIWTTKQILMWSRFHGYSPVLFVKPSSEEGRLSSLEISNKRLKSNESSSESDCDSSDYKKGKSNGGKFINGLSFLERKKNFKRGRKKGLFEENSTLQPKNYRNLSTYSDENDVYRCGSLEYRYLQCETPTEIDVVNVEVDVKPDPVPVAESQSKRKEVNLVVTTARSDEFLMNRFVTKASRQIGIKLNNEEIIPGVSCDSAVRVMSQAVFSFLDELLRKSFAQAWIRNGDRPPSSLELDDVLATLIENPQFDIFTNRGLGVQPVVKTEQ